MTANQEILMKQEQLILKLREGHESAYEALFKDYYRELVIHANRYLYDMDVSKEVVQDLFVNIYEKRHQLDINSSLKSYLYRAVQNRCINQINSKKIREKYVDYVKTNNNDDENLIERSIDASELETALYSAISDLPPKCRMIFKMNRFEGLSNGDIAERLELSKRTVETQITKALKMLRTKLQPLLASGIASLAALFLFTI